MSKTEKTYDCVESVRKERVRIAKETEGMSPTEILAYFQKPLKKERKTDKQKEKK